MESLKRLADLLRQRSAIDREIATMLNRPVHSGHIGEYVASAIFDIALNPSASAKGHDGRFTTGPFVDRSVNVKYASSRGGNLNLGISLDPADHPDFYLVLTGPKVAAGSSRGALAPWIIRAVFLFDTPRLLQALAARRIGPGTAASVRAELWDMAMIYPEAHNRELTLNPRQREALVLFSGESP